MKQTKPEPSLKVLGERIRAARKAAGFSQEDFALETGLDRSYMGGVERGQRNLSFLKLCAIARALEIDLSILTAALPAASREV